jgi:hypothetical protein
MPDELTGVREQYKRFRKEMEWSMQAACNQAAELLLSEMRRLTDMRDHTLEELRKEGHPYRAKAPQGVPHLDFMVHLQSGELQSGLRRRPARVIGKIVSAELHSDSEHTWYVILGTRYMRPRDFVTAALINMDREVGAIFEAFHRVVHDEGVASGYRTVRIPVTGHVRRPQLPGG